MKSYNRLGVIERISKSIGIATVLLCMAAIILTGCGSSDYKENVTTVSASDSSLSLCIDEIIDNKYVVQIPEFASVSQSKVIDDINEDISSLLIPVYESYMEGGKKVPEIKTILSESDKYLQAVSAYVEYPLLGSDGDVVSYNYVRDEDRRVTLSDALIMSDTTLDDLKNTIFDVYYHMVQKETIDSDSEFDAIFGITVDGFIINEDDSLDFYGNIDISSNGNDPWSYIYKYNNINENLEILK